MQFGFASSQGDTGTTLPDRLYWLQRSAGNYIG